MSRVSILILTLNEEVNLRDCIDSCAWSDDIIVFDSMSEDHTLEIAKERGARVVQSRFYNYAAQRNAALATVSYKHPWVLMVDADERVSAELATEIETAIAGVGADIAMFRMRRKDFFQGQWLRRSSGYPTWFGRLVKLGHVRVEREINEEYVPDGRVEDLRSHLYHFPFNKGIAYWIERHNRYSTLEALAKIAIHREPVELPKLFGRDPVARRRTLKKISYRLPMRPLMVFLYLYVFRLGALDGRAGFQFIRMRAMYERLIDLKVMESKRRNRGLSV
jgi:glycosyltransferase involved in cell wall biosynthesis